MADEALVPFGKYKDQPVSRLLADKSYTDWCKSNHVFDKVKNIYNVIYNIQTNTNDAPTPEHNKLQNRFLDKKYQLRLLNVLNLRDDVDVKCVFEANNWDLRFYLEKEALVQPDASCRIIEYRLNYGIEIKPLLGDDYPSVLRKMLTQIQRYKCDRHALLIGEFQSTAATIAQLREVFAQHKIKIVFFSELDAIGEAHNELSVTPIIEDPLIKIQTLEARIVYLQNLLTNNNISY